MAMTKSTGVAAVATAFIIIAGAIWSQSSLDYEDVVFSRFLADYKKYVPVDPTVPTQWNDEVNPAWWKWPPSRRTLVFNGAPVACPATHSCVNVSVAAMSLFLRSKIPPLLERRDLRFDEWRSRPYALCQLYSRARPHRQKIWANLSAFLQPAASLRGRHRNSVRIFDEATDLLSQCRFVAAVEGRKSPGYVTEKLVNALFAGAIPIYWGDSFATQLFNADAFLNVDNYVDAAAAGVAAAAIDANHSAAARLVSAPIATPASLNTLLWWQSKPHV